MNNISTFALMTLAISLFLPITALGMGKAPTPIKVEVEEVVNSARDCSSLANGSEIDTHRKYKDLEKMTECHRLPHMDQDYIPQGLYITKNDLAYISLYHKDKNSNKTKASEILEYNLNTSKLKKIYKLYLNDERISKGHVGGIAVFNNYSKIAVVSQGDKICIFDKAGAKRMSSVQSAISDGSNSPSTYKLMLANCQTQNLGNTRYTTGFSFINYAKDHNGVWHMWVGQFLTDTAMHIFAYPVVKGEISTEYSYRFYVPKDVSNVQGMSVVKASKNSYEFLLSSSFGAKGSTFTKVAYIYDSSRKTFKYRHLYSSHHLTLPAGSEELVTRKNGDVIWTLFESGANYFQHRARSPWVDNYPFLIKLDLKN